MAEYKCISYEIVEHTEIAQKSCSDFERSKDAPDDVKVETEWLATLNKLNFVLNQLTPRQREIYVMRVGYLLSETQIAEKLKLNQSTVSRHYHAAQKKLNKIIVK